jgi:myo-inositol-1(or 4)-monophosphatase
VRDAAAWLAVCRDCSAAVQAALATLATRDEREVGAGIGEGGDETVAVDVVAEQAVVARLEEVAAGGTGFTLVSEELGERVFGDGGDGLRLVVDPIDGSVNAKRSIPFHALSIAVAGGPAMRDVFLGYVHDLGSGEEWTAIRGGGAFLNGEPLTGPGPKDRLELISFEATMADLVAESIGAFRGVVERIRVLGSLALSLCGLAAGRFDGVVTLRPSRSVDIAAAQLLVRERGLAVDLPEWPPFDDYPLDVAGRSRTVAAATPELCDRLYAALTAGLPLGRARQS